MTNVGILAAYALVALIQPQWKTISIIRDWAALALTILCYNEMGWLAPARHRYEGEKGCIEWDRRFLKDWHMKAAIESCRSVFPIILELSYGSAFDRARVSLLKSVGGSAITKRFLF